MHPTISRGIGFFAGMNKNVMVQWAWIYSVLASADVIGSKIEMGGLMMVQQIIANYDKISIFFIKI